MITVERSDDRKNKQKQSYHTALVLFIILILGFPEISLLGQTQAYQKNYYFSSFRGNDSYAGNSPDQPWRSMAKLNFIVSKLQPGDVVYLERGSEWHEAKLNIENTSGNNSGKITIKAYGNGKKPVLSGGKLLSGTFTYQNGIWTTQNIKYALKDYIRVPSGLLINDKFHAISRHPNNSYYSTKSNGKTSLHDPSQSWTTNELVDGMVVARCVAWAWEIGTIISNTSQDINFSSFKHYHLNQDNYGSTYYFLQNVEKGLDLNGEWLFKQGALKVKYKDDLNSQKVEFPVVDTVLTISSSSHIEFRDIIFQQANAILVNVEKSTDITFLNCSMRIAGFTGLKTNHVKNLNIQHSHFEYLHSNGIMLNGAGETTIENNTFFKTPGVSGHNNESDRWGAAITNYYTDDKVYIRYNRFDSINIAYHTHWSNASWYFEKNIIKDFGVILGGDIGAVYNGGDWKNEIPKYVRRNIFIDAHSQPQTLNGSHPTRFSHGIYWDYDSRGIIVDSNTFINTNVALYSNQNHSNKFRYNTVVNGAKDMKDQWSSVIFLDGSSDGTTELDNHTISDNIIVHGDNQTEAAFLWHSGPPEKTIGSNFTIGNNVFQDPFGVNPVAHRAVENYFQKSRDYSISEFCTQNGYDCNSIKQPLKWTYKNTNGISREQFVHVAYNIGQTRHEIALNAIYIDLDGKLHKDKITLDPYESKVLFYYANNGTSPNDNLPPDILQQQFNVLETHQQESGNFIAQVEAYDNDNNQKLTFTLESGNESQLFQLNENGELFFNNGVNIDFTGNPSYSLVINVSDDGIPSLSDSDTITVRLFETSNNVSNRGLEGIFVEKYHTVSTEEAALDSNLTEGTVTYRVFVDLDEEYELHSLFGDNIHSLTINTTTEFYNSTNKGVTYAFEVSESDINEYPELTFDSWLAMGTYGEKFWAITLAEDTVDGIIDGYIQNEQLITPSFSNIQPVSNFNSEMGNGNFKTNDILLSADGVQGPTASNKILIGQFTTDGELSFELNLNVKKSGSNNNNEIYVAREGGNDNIQFPELSYPYPIIYGCMSPTACNFNPDVTISDESCIEPVPDCSECVDGILKMVDRDQDGICDANDNTGCMDSLACNYNPFAIFEGECTYPVKGCTECDEGKLILVDSDKDGICDQEDRFQSKKATLLNACNEQNVFLDFIANYELYENIGYELVVTYDASLVNPTDNYIFHHEQLNQDYLNVISSINRDNQEIYLYFSLHGSTPDSVNYKGTGNMFSIVFEKKNEFQLADSSSFFVTSAKRKYYTKYGIFTNYWVDLNIQSICKSPEYGGCTSNTACNYDMQALFENNTCIEPIDNCSECHGDSLIAIDLDSDGICDAKEIAGCTNPMACNYNNVATEDDGSCIIPVTNCTECNGENLILIDANNDGICDGEEQEIPGCTNKNACNFYPMATVNNGSCIFPSNECYQCIDDTLGLVDINNNGICDSEEEKDMLNYTLNASQITCLDKGFCVNLISLDTLRECEALYFLMNYPSHLVVPDSSVIVNEEIINPDYFMFSSFINSTTGTILISVMPKSNLTGITINGIGELFCLRFTYLDDYPQIETTTDINISAVYERYNGDWLTKTGNSGILKVPYKDIPPTYAQLSHWKNNAPLVSIDYLNEDYGVAKVYYTDSLCAIAMEELVLDQNNKFELSSPEHKNLLIKKDIPNKTRVMKYINGLDAVLTKKVLLNDTTFTPSTYQIIAMDVNRDGVISSGDLSQINQRTLHIIDEFNQYNLSEQNYISNDWLFVNEAKLNNDPHFKPSVNYPFEDNAGYTKRNIPVVEECQEIPPLDLCNSIQIEYKGILLGDVDGNIALNDNTTVSYKKVSESSLKSKLVLDIKNATITNDFVDVPVYLTFGETNVHSLDFILPFHPDLEFSSVINKDEDIDILHHKIGNTLLLTSYKLEPYPFSSPIFLLRFRGSLNELSENDFDILTTYINGTPGEYTFSETTNSQFNPKQMPEISLYPNPANTVLYVKTSETCFVEMIDMNGRKVIRNISVERNKTYEINTSNIASGIYSLNIFNEQFSEYRKIVIQK